MRLTILLLVAIAPFLSPTQSADLILHNGAIYTVNARKPWAEAVAIKGDRIVAVGSDKDVMRLRSAQTRVIDLERRFALPGFNDDHVHFAQAAAFLEFNIMAVGSQEDFVARIKEVSSTLPKGEWIVGGFWGAYDQWATGSAGIKQLKPFEPDMSRIEALTADYPVFIRKFDDTQFAANRAALRAVKVDLNNPQAPDIEFLKDEKGQLTGQMRGKGVARLIKLSHGGSLGSGEHSKPKPHWLRFGSMASQTSATCLMTSSWRSTAHCTVAANSQSACISVPVSIAGRN